MWEKVKTFCLNSATIAWAYVLAIGGFLLDVACTLADIVSDPSFKQALADTLGNPKLFAYALMLISVITFIARLRSLRKAP